NPHGNADIFARNLPSGPVIRVTANDAHQINPDIDGTVVTWQDKRNVTEPPNIDVFRKDLIGGPESIVTFSPGDQGVPVISGDTVAWRDQRRGPTKWDVYARVGAGDETLVWEQPASDIPPLGTLGFAQTVALDGGRLVWDHIPDCGDPGGFPGDQCPSQLLTCVLPCAGGGVPVDPDPDQGQIDPDVSGSRIVWGTTGNSFEGGAFVKDMSSGAAAAAVDTALTRGGAPEIEGTLVTWNGAPCREPTCPIPTDAEQGQDIFWRDVTSAALPLRANSIGFGGFEGGGSPTASGNNVVYHRRSRVYGTSLTPRDDFEVSSGLATGTGRPMIVGSRAVWFEGVTEECIFNEDGPPDCTVTDVGGVFSRDPFSSGPTTQLSDPDGMGGPPDVDGTKVVWRCDDTTLCVREGATITPHDISGSLVSPSSIVVDRVRLAGDTVVWGEFEQVGVDETSSVRLHALHLLSDDDEILGPGPSDSEPVFNFDISGNKVVWTGRGGSDPGRSKVWLNTVAGCPPGTSPCDHVADAVEFEVASESVEFGDVSIDGLRAAWDACFFDEGGGTCDIYTRLLSEPGHHLVTDGSMAGAREPYVDGDRILWVYDTFISNFTTDIMMESVTGDPLPQPELVPPGIVKNLKAVVDASVTLTWTNPGDSDFKGVRILRKSGNQPPSSPTDPTASILFDGLSASFIDKDVTSGQRYAYAVFTYDEFPNFSSAVTKRT
ncbi:MAG TPA: hypothetical protein VI541_03130, partial [Actinomycetota bacterium]|nr:hypothetical protein [Actinomycetota bacterium]